MAAKKFTFKTTKPTGRYRSFENDYHEIKLNGKSCGTISDHDKHKIKLQVIKADVNEDGKPNCPWKWIVLKKENASIDEAKLWLNEHFEGLNTRYKIHAE